MKTFVYLFLFLPIFLFGQIAHYNQFPSMHPKHILDDKLDNISFAFGLRILESDYNGPLIRLRRNNDNAEMDFFCRDDDKVDVEAINAWRGASNVFVSVWYDQSGLGRNAVQTTTNRQPRFFPDNVFPYFEGDGANDYLQVNTSIQILTNAGANATILTVFTATRKNQYSFGVNGATRWLSHINWGDNRLYFDPGGPCCNALRSFNNTNFQNQWAQYTFLRGANTVSVRRQMVIGFDGGHNRGPCTLNSNFRILHATGGSNNLTSNNKVNEMIMYRTDIAADIYTEIEENQMTFWGL